jgi:hypothetical protein
VKNYLVTLVAADPEEDGNNLAAKLWSVKINVKAETGEIAIEAAKAALKFPKAFVLRDLECQK